MSEPCNVASVFPNHDPLVPQTEEYQFTVVCSDPNLYIKGHYSFQGVGGQYPFVGSGPSVVIDKITIPQGCQGFLITARCYVSPKDETWVCQEFHEFAVQQ